MLIYFVQDHAMWKFLIVYVSWKSNSWWRLFCNFVRFFMRISFNTKNFFFACWFLQDFAHQVYCTHLTQRVLSHWCQHWHLARSLRQHQIKICTLSMTFRKRWMLWRWKSCILFFISHVYLFSVNCVQNLWKYFKCCLNIKQ